MEFARWVLAVLVSAAVALLCERAQFLPLQLLAQAFERSCQKAVRQD
ncbi:MAG: hypothetical protein ACRCWB_01440 [Enterovibrio sp.]